MLMPMSIARLVCLCLCICLCLGKSVSVYVYVQLRLCPEDGYVCLCLYINVLFPSFFMSVRHLRTNIGLRFACQSVYLCLHLSSSFSIFNDKNGTQSPKVCLQEILEQQKACVIYN